MRHFLFSGQETPDEIRRILLDNCEGMEEMDYTEQLTEVEINELREQLVENCIEIGKQNEILQNAKSHYKSTVTPITIENKEILHSVKSKHREVKGKKVYKLTNLESGMMDYVNEKGIVVHSRKLKPEEKQIKVFSLPIAVNE